MTTDTKIRTTWEKNDIIRNIDTGDPLLVIHVYTYIATVVVDLQDARELALAYFLLPKNYEKYAVDTQMEKVTKNGTIEWEYKPLSL